MEAPTAADLLRMLVRYRARVALVALAAVAIWEISVLAAAKRQAPTDESWRAAATALAASYEPGDLIIPSPVWIDPLIRRWFGDLMTLDGAARMDSARYGRIWEISIRGAVAPEVATLVAEYDEMFAGVRVRRFSRSHARVTWDLRAHARIFEVDHQPRMGVVLSLRHPDDGPRLRFDRVALGSELQVYAGVSDSEHRKFNRSRGLLRVFVDGNEATRALVDTDSGWLALPLVETGPGLHDVEITAEVERFWGPIVLDLCVAVESRYPR